MFKSKPQSQGYELAPPPYESESSRPFINNDEEEQFGEDMFKETVANSTIEIRMRKNILAYIISTV